MSQLNDLIKMLDVSGTTNEEVSQNDIQIETLPAIPPNSELFDINVFVKELGERSSTKNRLYREAVQNISAYDISSGCIREIVYKLTNTPVESFADSWLPVLMRSTIGTAIHEFIQNNTNQFTEREISLKIPSIRFSGRLDNLIGVNNLVEIKSCPYSDYINIVKNRKPRVKDFYQAMIYKYIIENYLEEAKDPKIKIRDGSSKPKFDKYDIDTIQFIYVAHDVISADIDSFAEMLGQIKQLKQTFNSKSNNFFFMTTIVNNITDDIAAPFLEYVKNKISAINYYLDKQQLPDLTDSYIDTKQCFFCLYKRLCR